MATINTASPFVNATAMKASDWNTKYDLLYNEFNGNLDNANFATTAGVLENKIAFAGAGHAHASIGTIGLTSITTVGAYKGEIIYYTGSTWAKLGTGANATELKFDYDANTTLLCNFDGANSATTFTAATGQTATFEGTAVLSTTSPKFGTASLSLASAGSAYVTFPDSADWNFGTGNFTIDGWFKWNTPTKIYQYFLGQYEDADNRWFIGYSYGGGNGYLRIYFIDGGTDLASYSALFNPTAGNWYHITFERISTIGRIFVNGVSSTLIENTAFGSNNVGDITANLHIGESSSAVTSYFDGFIDELRISKGLARWTANFTPETLPYSPGLIWK